MSTGELDVVLRAGRTYAELLANISELTDLLSEAVAGPDLDRVDQLLQTRESLCSQIPDLSAELFALSQDFERDREVQNLLEHVSSLHAAILRKQSECERLLAAQLQECKATLGTFHQRRGLKQTYGTSGGRNHARFLDSKL